MSNQTVSLDVIRTLAFGGISGAYAPVGTQLTEPVRLICFTNDTDAGMFFSDDGVNNKLYLPPGTFKLFDITTNKIGTAPIWCFAPGTQFSVKQASAPGKGAVYIECLWGV